jgi:hypothetical protein
MEPAQVQPREEASAPVEQQPTQLRERAPQPHHHPKQDRAPQQHKPRHEQKQQQPKQQNNEPKKPDAHQLPAFLLRPIKLPPAEKPARPAKPKQEV